jgi:hypothetical protein
MTTAAEHANNLFKRAALGDEDLGYPEQVAFLAEDMDGALAVFDANMWSGTPTVVVSSRGGEMIVIPMPRRGLLGAYDRVRGRVHVRVATRGDLRSEIEVYGTVRAHGRHGHRPPDDATHVPAHA